MHQKNLIEREVHAEQETKNFASEAVNYFKIKDIVLLYGSVGSGKTFLTREFVSLLGCGDEVSSPSFSIVNQYSGNILINHIDLYRISEQNELKNLGLSDLWELQSINFVEWPQLIENHIVWMHYKIFIDVDHQRPFWRKFKLTICDE